MIWAQASIICHFWQNSFNYYVKQVFSCKKGNIFSVFFLRDITIIWKYQVFHLLHDTIIPFLAIFFHMFSFLSNILRDLDRQSINAWFINVILKWLINTIHPFSIRPLHVIELIPWFAGITSAFPIWYQKVESSSIFLNNYSFTCKNMCVCTQGVSEYVCLTLITRACITSVQWQ